MRTAEYGHDFAKFLRKHTNRESRTQKIKIEIRGAKLTATTHASHSHGEGSDKTKNKCGILFPEDVNKIAPVELVFHEYEFIIGVDIGD